MRYRIFLRDSLQGLIYRKNLIGCFDQSTDFVVVGLDTEDNGYRDGITQEVVHLSVITLHNYKGVTFIGFNEA